MKSFLATMLNSRNRIGNSYSATKIIALSNFSSRYEKISFSQPCWIRHFRFSKSQRKLVISDIKSHPSPYWIHHFEFSTFSKSDSRFVISCPKNFWHFQIPIADSWSVVPKTSRLIIHLDLKDFEKFCCCGKLFTIYYICSLFIIPLRAGRTQFWGYANRFQKSRSQFHINENVASKILLTWFCRSRKIIGHVFFFFQFDKN